MAKMGRPKVENPADKRITIRLNGEEHELLLEYTKNHNMTMTQVVKMAVLEKIMADLQRADSTIIRVYFYPVCRRPMISARKKSIMIILRHG